MVDVDGDGNYNVSVDALGKSNFQVNAGFFVIPEYWYSIMALIVCFGAYFTYKKTGKARVVSVKIWRDVRSIIAKIWTKLIARL